MAEFMDINVTMIL